MNGFKSIVIARQLDELRTESAARRLARTPPGADEPKPHAMPKLTNYPYPAR
jgi:hypothetical protein